MTAVKGIDRMGGDEFGWEADPDAGKIIEQYRGSGRSIDVDPRFDVLIDVGIILGQEVSLLFEKDKILISRASSRDYVQYSVLVDDGLVFAALYHDDKLDFDEYLVGPWIFRIAALTRSLRQTRRIHSGASS